MHFMDIKLGNCVAAALKIQKNINKLYSNYNKESSFLHLRYLIRYQVAILFIFAFHFIKKKTYIFDI